MERKYNTVFMDSISSGWILGILGHDIMSGLERIGYKCREGNYEDYQGEDISFHMWWIHATPHKDAKVNAIFITHTDDECKEKRLIEIKDKFDIFFCMSPEDAQFLIELGYAKEKVFGINLPVRNNYIRPISMGIFSRCYPDKRKNEEWLYHFCSNNPQSKLIDFVFIGGGWGEFVNRLSQLGCSFQWHNVSRDMPFEYMYQQFKMSNLDYYMYMGMDGGAMGTYDAYAMGASLCVTDDGFHKGIPNVDYLFSNEEEFCNRLSQIVEKQYQKIKFFSDNNVDHYVDRVAYVLENCEYPEDSTSLFDYSVKEKRRENYFNRSWKYELYRNLSVVVTNYMNRLKLENKSFTKKH